MKTNLLRFWITALMMLVTTASYAYDAIVDGIYYNFSGTNATVTYLEYWSDDNSTAYKGDIVIPSTVEYKGKTYNVTSIDTDAFWKCANVTSITLHNGITDIGSGAFGYCSGLTTMELPNSVKKLSANLFIECSNLISIQLPSDITEIPNGLFVACRSLLSVNIPQGVTSIGENAFSYCYKLKSISIPESVTSIGKNAFLRCDALTSLTIPRNVKQMGYMAVYNCAKLNSIDMLPLEAPQGDFYGTSQDKGPVSNRITIHTYKTATGYDQEPWNYCTIKKDIPITIATGISLNSSSEYLSKESTLSLKATVAPSNVTINDVTWSSSDEKVLKCLGNGEFKAVTDGFAFVHATTVDGSNLTAKCRVVVGNAEYIDVSEVSLDQNEITLHKGETQTLKATYTPGNASFKSVVWSSSNENVVTVDVNGVLKAVGKGSATITAIAEDNESVKATCKVQVLAPLTTSMKLNVSDVYMDIFETMSLKVIPTPSDAEPNVTWTTSNENVVMVDEKGKLTPMGEGDAIVTAKATDGSGKAAAASVTVKHAPYNPYLSAKKTGYSYTSWTGYSINFELKNNGSEIINVIRVTVKDPSTFETLSTTTDASLLGTLYPGGTKELSYKASANINIATEWEYTYKGESYTFCSWKTYPIVAESVTLDKTFLNLALGETAQLTATVSPKEAKSEVEWESSDTQVVTVDTDGSVRTVGAGHATITAISTDGTHRKATCDVTVTKYDVTKITLKQSSCNLEISSSITLEPTITPANAYNKNLVWTSSNEDVAMVNSSGKVVGIAEGEAVITVASEEHPEVTASVTVKVIPVLVKSITLNYTNYTLDKGENIQLVATLLPENAPNKAVKWSTDNEDVIMVSNSGRCVYLADGKATVTATTCDGSNLSASCVFNCTDGIITITTDSPDLEIFTTDGRRLNEMQNGINIIRIEDGRTVKVLRK